MRLTVVGCSGSFPGPDSAASCYLVEHDGFRVVLDLGNGALGALQRHVDIHDGVHAVLLSHLHADHCVDLCGYYVARKYRPGGPSRRLPVHGPLGTAARLAAAYDLPAGTDMTAEFGFMAYPEGPYTLGPFTVRTARVAHPVPAYAVRLEAGGRALTYSGDTGPTPALVDLAAGSDLLLCEAAFRHGQDNPRDLHLTGREAGEHATAARVGKLVVTHVPPWHSRVEAAGEARGTFAGTVQAATPDAVYDL